MNGYCFDNKVVLITGASGGVGEGLCQYFCRRGATVLAVARNAEPLEQLAESLGENCFPMVTDVADLSVLKDAMWPIIDSTGHVEILINNAGAAAATTLSNLTPEAWQHDINLNLTGAYHCVE